MALVIKGGTIVSAEHTFKGDVLVEGEKIAAVGRDIKCGKGDEAVNAEGKYVFPGGIDAHTHFELPFMGTVSSDNFATGTRAAIIGGTTTIIDFIIPQKGMKLMDAFAAWMKKAKNAVADYGFHMAIVEYNEKIENEIPKVIKAGITSFKCFMAYKGSLQIDDAALIGMLTTAGKNGGLVSVHAENGDIIAMLTKKFLDEGKTAPEYHYRAHPAEAEEEAVHRAIALAKFAGRTIYVVHLSSAAGLQKIKEARARGEKVLAETCPQYLLLSSDLYSKPKFEGAKWVMSPPIRTKENHEALWNGLNNGFIQLVATDHCPFNFKGQKDMGKGDFTKIPNGIAGVGDRLNLMYTYGVGKGKISLNRFVDVVSTTPAKIFGLYPHKGCIMPGADADIVIFDPNAKGEISAKDQAHNVDYSAYEGFKLKGMPTDVLLRGKFALRNGKYVGKQGLGKYIARSSSG